MHFTSATGAVHSGLTVFYNDFKDKITRIQCPVTICTDGPNDFGSDPTYRVNVDEAVTQGVEWSLDADITEAVAQHPVIPIQIPVKSVMRFAIDPTT